MATASDTIKLALLGRNEKNEKRRNAFRAGNPGWQFGQQNGLTMELTGATDAARCGGESDRKR